MTVALTNYDPNFEPSPETNEKKWYCSVFFGSGKNFDVVIITPAIRKTIEIFLVENMKTGAQKFMIDYSQEFEGKIGNSKKLQELLEINMANEGEYLSPIQLVTEVKSFIEEYDMDKVINENVSITHLPKNRFPKRQLLAMWAISKFVS